MRIDTISKDLAAVVPREEVPQEEKAFYWSLNDDLSNSQPIIGRDAFRDAVTQMAAPDAERALVVSGPPESGLNFSIKLLRHALGGVGVPVAIFTPQQLQSDSMTPKQFLRHLVGNLGILGLAGQPFPDLPSMDSFPHWLRVVLPQWLLTTLTTDQAINPTAYPKWVVVNTVVPKDESFLWADNLLDLMVALLGVHDANNPGTDLPQLRWLFLAKDPDANSNAVPLPLAGVKHLSDDLSKETDYDIDFAQCMLRAWRANNKDERMSEKYLRLQARKMLKEKQPGAGGQVVPPRKSLAIYVSEMIRDDLLEGGGE